MFWLDSVLLAIYGAGFVLNFHALFHLISDLAEATMRMEELLPYDGETKDISYVVDYHNGTVAVLYGSDESGAVYPPRTLPRRFWIQRTGKAN